MVISPISHGVSVVVVVGRIFGGGRRRLIISISITLVVVVVVVVVSSSSSSSSRRDASLSLKTGNNRCLRRVGAMIWRGGRIVVVVAAAVDGQGTDSLVDSTVNTAASRIGKRGLLLRTL